MKVKLKTIIISPFEYLTVLFLILDCYSVYAVAVRDYYINEITAILIFFLFLSRIALMGFKKSMLEKWLKYHVVYYAVALFLMIMSVSAEEAYNYSFKYLIVLPLLTMLLLHYAEDRNACRLFEIFSNILLALSVISIFFWIFASNLHVIQPTGGMMVDWGYVKYYPMYLGVYGERQTQEFLFYNGFRNQSIFAEAPMYSFVLVMAISYEIFLRPAYVTSLSGARSKSRSVLRLCILIAALLTTITTTGYILLMGVFVLKYMISKPKEAIIRNLKRLSSILVIGLAIFVALSIFQNKTTSVEKVSWIARADDLYAGFRAFLLSPIYGTGYGSYEGINRFRGAFRAESAGVTSGFSNSLMLVLAQGGLVFLFMYMYPTVKAIMVAINTKQYGLMSFALMFMVDFAITLQMGTILGLFIVAFLYAIAALQQNKQIINGVN